MAIPAAITPITVTGQFILPDGSPAVGDVSFTPSIVATTEGALLPVSPLTVTLDDTGSFSVVLAATDDPQWAATGFTYSVTERVIGSAERTYNIEVPAASAGGTLDLSEAAPVAEPAVVSQYAYASISKVDARGYATLQAAIDALPVGGGEVYLPTGTYNLTSALQLESGVNLVSDGDITTVIHQTTASANCVQGTNVERVGLRNIQLTGPGSGTGHGLALTKGGGNHTAYVALDNVTLYNFGGDGVRIENPIVSTFSRVISVSNGGYGINLYGQNSGAAGTSCTLNSCYGNGNTTGGTRLYNMVYCSLNGCAADSNPIGYLVDGCQSVTLAGCGAENNTTAGFKVNAGYGTTLAGAWVYDNLGIGIHVTGNANTVSVIGATDNSPGESATNFIKVDSGCHVALLNCSNDTANSLAAGTTNIVSDGSGGAQFQEYTALLKGGEFDGDLTCYVAEKGIVLTDRSSGTPYRLKVTGGTLGVEAV